MTEPVGQSRMRGTLSAGPRHLLYSHYAHETADSLFLTAYWKQKGGISKMIGGHHPLIMGIHSAF